MGYCREVQRTPNNYFAVFDLTHVKELFLRENLVQVA